MYDTLIEQSAMQLDCFVHKAFIIVCAKYKG